MVILGGIFALTAFYFKNYWLLIFAAAWLIMPFTISFTYKEDADGNNQDLPQHRNGRQTPLNGKEEQEEAHSMADSHKK